MRYPQDGTKSGAMGGEFIGCGEKDCEKGEVFMEAPERCSMVACPVCDGKGYIVVWRSIDLSRLRVAA